MKNIFLLLTVLLTVFQSCNDDSLVVKEASMPNKTKAAIETRNFNWEKLKYIEFKDNLSRTRIVPAPWIVGSAMNLGIPSYFQDINFNENSDNNLYSTKNGWRLLYHNLDLTGDPYKYLILYNKYTGIARAFFLSMASSNSVVNSNATFIGFRINGSSSLLNYTSADSFDGSKKFNNSVFISSPTRAFNMTAPVKGVETTIDNYGVGYENEKWYATEIELSYDPSLNSSNTLDIVITAAQTSLTYTSGSFSGKIAGNITTNAQNPSSINLDLSQTTTKTMTINAGGSDSKSVLESKTKNSSFFGKLKSNASKWVSDAFNKSGKELIDAIFSQGASALADGFGSLLSSFTGLGGSSQQVSKVDLTFDGEISLKSTTTTMTNAWGEVLELPITGQNQYKLYEGNLGVWTLSETPKFYAAFDVTGYYQDEDPTGTIRDYKAGAILYLAGNPTIVLNPDIAKDYTIKDIKTNVCHAGNNIAKNDNNSFFGQTNNLNVYLGQYLFKLYNPGSFTKDNFVTRAKNTYSLSANSLYSKLSDLHLYYYISFRLEPKNNNGKDVYFTRYIKAELYKKENSGVFYFTERVPM